MASKRLLSEREDDHDATLVASDGDRLSEADSFLDVQDHDRQVLEQEEAEQSLMTKEMRLQEWRHGFTKRGKEPSFSEKSSQRKKRRRDARRRRSQAEADTEVMFEMEGGFKDTSSQSSRESLTQPKWATPETRQRHNRRRIVFFLIPIVALLGALIFGAYRASSPSRRPSSIAATWSNGTSIFRPTTILISLDGFRADFLARNITPALSALIASGVSPQYMLPSFPSVTFPNHFTLVTGLYPESHGVVGNQFWDPKLQEEFYYTDVKVSMQPKWWTAEPLWVTAENQGVRTAIHMWPGSEAHIPDVEPTYLDKFNETEALTRKVDRILNLVDLPGDEDDEHGDKRPQLIAAYVPNVDADGHLYGPNSTEIRNTIADVDSMLMMLMEGLYARNLTDIVNLIIVSDHGMATTSTFRLVQLDDLIDLSLVDHIDGWPLRGLRLKNPDRDVPVFFEKLSAAAAEIGSFDVYTLETMPKRYHFSNNDRIAPLWVVPRTGWAVVEKADFDVAEAQITGKQYHPKGLHGYDHEHPLMRAIFIAQGPAFPHTPNSRLSNFQNTEVYNIVCDSLGVKTHPNNGTLRLPLKTVGLHGDMDFGSLPVPIDPPTQPDPPSEVTPAEAGDQDHPEKPTSKLEKWLEYIKSQIEKAKDWAKGYFKSSKDDKNISTPS